MAWKILLPQEIMSEGRKLLEDAGHTIIMGRGFETEDVLADMKEHQPDAMIVRITCSRSTTLSSIRTSAATPSRRRTAPTYTDTKKPDKKPAGMFDF